MRRVVFAVLVLLAAARVHAQTPILAYAFDDGAGTSPVDAISGSAIGTLTNTTWGGGHSGTALVFDGTARLSIPNAPALQGLAALTLEAWVRPADMAAGWEAILYRGLDNAVLALGNNHLTVGITSGPGAGVLTLVTAPSAIPALQWTHLALTFDGAILRGYVNGTEVVSHLATSPIVRATTPFEIGGSAMDGGGFRGTIDSVRVWSVARTAAQVQADMATPVAPAIIVNPTAVAFTASTDQGTPTLDHYDLTIWRVDNQHVLAYRTSIGLPTPDATRTITLALPPLLTPAALTPGIPYHLMIDAVGPTGSAISVSSQQFVLGLPAPTLTVVPPTDR